MDLRAGDPQRSNHEHTRRLHEERMRNGRTPEPDETPELARAFHDLNAYWLKTQPAYRALIQERVKREAWRIANLEGKRDRWMREDVDRLGREVDGCG